VIDNSCCAFGASAEPHRSSEGAETTLPSRILATPHSQEHDGPRERSCGGGRLS
jgi:hypothetical protein